MLILNYKIINPFYTNNKVVNTSCRVYYLIILDHNKH